MKRVLGAAVVTALAAVLAGYGTTRAEAKVEYTKKEGKSCVVCHIKNGAKELNDVGKCYEKNKTLKGCLPDDKTGKDKEKDKKDPPK